LTPHAHSGKLVKVRPPKDPLKRALYSPDEEGALILYSPEDEVDVSEFLPEAPAPSTDPDATAPPEPIKVHGTRRAVLSHAAEALRN